MPSNPILTAFKIAAFAILAFLVWITFWQGLKQEERVLDLKQRIGTMRGELAVAQGRTRELKDAVREQNARVGALTDLMARGGVHLGGGSAGSPAPRPTDRPSADGVPEWLSPKARALWGRWDDYLAPDPDAPPIPPLDQEGIDPSGRLRVHYGDQPSKINTVTASDALVTERLEQYVMQTLATTHTKNPSMYAPELAVRIEKSDDYTEWVVFLRNDALWHTPQVDLDRYTHLKGRHLVTAHDVKFTLDLILNQDVDAGHLRSYYTECAGIEVVEDFCFIVRWRKPQFTSISFTLGLQPIPQFVFAYDEAGEAYEPAQLGLAFNDHWFYRSDKLIGCGPYFVAELDTSSHILLRRFDDYFGSLPPIREIHQQIFPEERLALTKLESREFDAHEVQIKDWERKVLHATKKNPFNDGRMGAEWFWRTGYSFIAWKNTHPIFKDAQVRKAMTLACDRFRVADVLYVGKAKVATGPQHTESPFAPPDLEPLPFDLDAAAALLAEQGWKDANGNGVLEKVIDGQEREFRFQAMVPNHEVHRAVFEIYKEDLDKIGVKMTLDFLNWKQFAEKLHAREFECTSLGWSGSGWESDLYQIWHSSQIDEVPSSNFIEFSDPVADELIVRLRGVFEHEERVRLQQKLHRRIAELQPYTFLITSQRPFYYWEDRVWNASAAVQAVTRPKIRFQPMAVRAGP